MALSKRLRVVVDTNVFVSAVLWGGAPQKVIQAWLDRKISLLLSPYLAAEIRSVLERFSIPADDLAKIIKLLSSHTTKILPKTKIDLCRDPKDNEILSLAVSGNADFLVTGDRDLLVIGALETTTIVKPSAFLREVR